VRAGRFPLTYDECRERFRWTAASAGATTSAHRIDARGPVGQELTIDVTCIGSHRPSRALLVLAGVHGDEGFSGSVLQCDAIERWASPHAATGVAPLSTWPDDVGVVLVHGVNPWGMAMWRRQNESNVDLNRNWDRSGRSVIANAGYEQLHDVLCPGPPAPPDADTFLSRTRALIDRHGYPWVKAAVTEGQYSHPDGLYFGGDRDEQSTLLLGQIVADRLGAATNVLVVDLHTGHGDYGTYTLLSDAPAGSVADRWLRDVFDGERVESTGEPGTTASAKPGQLARGLNDVCSQAVWRTTTMEVGTCSDTRMILAERAEHWVHLHGDRNDPEHARLIWDHRCCSTPDDPDWESLAREHGRTVLDAAVAGVSSMASA
jgi:Protein of unknown function (DUF2817)